MATNSTQPPAHGWRGTLQQFLPRYRARIFARHADLRFNRKRSRGRAGRPPGATQDPYPVRPCQYLRRHWRCGQYGIKGAPFEAASLLQIPVAGLFRAGLSAPAGDCRAAARQTGQSSGRRAAANFLAGLGPDSLGATLRRPPFMDHHERLSADYPQNHAGGGTLYLESQCHQWLHG